MAEQSGGAYVVTGPAFLGNVSRIGNVAVPNYLWKAGTTQRQAEQLDLDFQRDS